MTNSIEARNKDRVFSGIHSYLMKLWHNDHDGTINKLKHVAVVGEGI